MALLFDSWPRQVIYDFRKNDDYEISHKIDEKYDPAFFKTF